MDSTSQPSPKSPIWKKVLDVLGDPMISPADQSKEIWRAAASDPDGALLENLSQPLIIKAYQLASEETDASNALYIFDGLIISSHSAGLFLDIAKRALAHAVLCKGGSRQFAQELFSEVISYYAARDLSELVGNQDRIPTVFDILRLKEDFRDLAREIVKSCGDPPVEAADWGDYVRQVLFALQANP
jgi:hypothetical protein